MLFQLVFVIKYFIWLQMEKYILLHREIIPVIKLQMVTTHFVLKNTRKKWMIFYVNIYALKYINGLVHLPCNVISTLLCGTCALGLLRLFSVGFFKNIFIWNLKIYLIIYIYIYYYIISSDFHVFTFASGGI